MATISIYRDPECTELIGSGFTGEYSLLTDRIGTIKQSTQVIDGQSYKFTQGFDCFFSSAKGHPEPTVIPLPQTLGTSRQYFYFNPRFRCGYVYRQSGTSTLFQSYSFEVKLNGSWTIITDWSESGSSAYKHTGICFRTAASMQRYSTGTMITGGFIGLDLVTQSAQGQLTERRAFMCVNHADVLLNLSDGSRESYKPKTGNSRRGGTGQGYYPNNPIPALPTNAINAAFSSVLGRGNGLTYYKLTAGSLSEITEFLYDCSLSLKFRNSQYRDAIASCVFIPYNVPVQVANTLGIVYLANKSIPVSGGCDIITEPLVEIDFGTVNLTADQIGFKSFADYVYTSASLYLPCFGSVNVDMHAMANGELHLRAVIDCRNGNIMYRLEVRGELDDLPVLYGQYNGNCGIPVPIGGANNGISLLGAASAIGNVAAGYATGNPLNIVGGVSSLAMQTAPTIDTAGALQPAGAALGTPVPVLQIRKKVLLQPPKWEEIAGRPSGGANSEDKFTLGDFTGGFVQAAWCDVSGIQDATDAEKQQIELMLKGGVFV